MHRKTQTAVVSSVFGLLLASFACAISQPTPATRFEPTATHTVTPTATRTRRPSPTPRPTRTPDLAATQRADELIAEVLSYYEKGYLTTLQGRFSELDNFTYEWAQLGWYKPFMLEASPADFFMSAHFKWDSASRSSDTSGCGFIFGLQPNDDHYAVFLDRSKVIFLMTDSQLGYSKHVGTTRGTGRVKLDYPAEADFTLIVKGAYAYVLVNGEVVGEYTLSQSRPVRGSLGMTVLSGTNKDYGTRCEMTNLHLWFPTE